MAGARLPLPPTTGVSETPDYRYGTQEYFANVNGIAGMNTVDDRARNTVVLTKQMDGVRQEELAPASRQLQAERDTVKSDVANGAPDAAHVAGGVSSTRKIVVDAFMSHDSIQSNESGRDHDQGNGGDTANISV